MPGDGKKKGGRLGGQRGAFLKMGIGEWIGSLISGPCFHLYFKEYGRQTPPYSNSNQEKKGDREEIKKTKDQ